MITSENKPNLLQALNDLTPSQRLLELISGNWVSQSIYAIAKLGIADLLKDGPQHINKLAQAVEADVQSLYRVMRALASVGVFIEVEDKYFQLTPISECLQTEHPNSLKALSILLGGEQYQAWANILYSVKTGKCAYEHQNGFSFFDYIEKNAEAGQIFDEAMTAYSQQSNASIAHTYNFSQFNKIVDVGGGHGALISAILKAYPHLTGVLFDTPHAVEGGQKQIRSAGLSERCEVIGGDFFKSVPSGGDIYTLSSIIHDWDNDASIAILRNCHEAMVKNGTLLIIEQVIPQGNERFFGKWLDLHMLIMHGGHDRTEAEYQSLLNSAGFKMTNVIPTQFSRSIVEAVRI